MKPTFLNQNKPLITCMIQAKNVSDAVHTARAAAFDGCDAYGFQIEQLDPAQRSEDKIKSIFRQMGNKPIYVTSYRSGFNQGKTDDELAEDLLFLRKCGATLLDVMGDYFCPDPIQLTRNPTAIEKQKALIERIHETGGEVLMSSHTLKFMSADEVLDIAFAQKERGADIVKIVTASGSEDEELENLRIITLLKRELGIPFLYLAGGSHCKFIRTIGAMMGSCMWLTVHDYDELATMSQPMCRAIRAIADNFDWMPDREG